MIETYQTDYNKKVIATYFSGNVQWHYDDSKQMKVEPKKAFIFRVDKGRWQLIETKK